MNKFEVILSEAADRDLLGIHQYVYDTNHSIAVADKTLYTGFFR